jgi:D-alanine-D-alanine ligase
MNLFKDKIIGVLLGGLSKEREISIKSGQAILEALLLKGYDALPVDVGSNIAGDLKKKGVEVAFLALHGRYGEDGCMQGLLEILQIPYTGSGVMASAVAMDKFLTKEILRGEGIHLARHFFYDHVRGNIDEVLQANHLPYPVMVKPSREGSTIGIVKVGNPQELKAALLQAAQLDSRVLVEEFIPGREITVSVLNGEALPVVEIVPKSGFYDFHSKYTVGASQYFCPADLPPNVTQTLQEQSQRICARLGCEGAARVDFILAKDERPFFLEVNTLPGMTNTSLVPKAAKAAGISFEDLVEKILLSARLKVQ